MNKISKVAITIAGVFGVTAAMTPIVRSVSTVKDDTGQICRVESDGAKIVDPNYDYYGREFASMEATEIGENGPVKGNAIFNPENRFSEDVKGGFIVDDDSCTVITDGKDNTLGWISATRFEFKRESGPL